MVSEQIFLSYCREDQPTVLEIYNELKKLNYNIWFDLENSIIGEKFERTIELEIKKSKLFIICWPLKQKDCSIFNSEVFWIDKALPKLSSNTKVINVFLYKKKNSDINSHLTEYGWVDYDNTKTKKHIISILKSLSRWAVDYAVHPPNLSVAAIDKLKQEPASKRALALWLSNAILPIGHNNKSIFVGCGTTIADAWFIALRNYFLLNPDKHNVFTVNSFIEFTEETNKKQNKRFVPLKIIGDHHCELFGAYYYSEPQKNMEYFDLSIISVAGFRVLEDKIDLFVCWDELKTTLCEALLKTRKEIIIIAAGRKILENECAYFGELLQLMSHEGGMPGRKLTIAVDTDIKEDRRKQFDEKIALMAKLLGCKVNKKGEIIFLKVSI